MAYAVMRQLDIRKTSADCFWQKNSKTDLVQHAQSSWQLMICLVQSIMRAVSRDFYAMYEVSSSWEFVDVSLEYPGTCLVSTTLNGIRSVRHIPPFAQPPSFGWLGTLGRRLED